MKYASITKDVCQRIRISECAIEENLTFKPKLGMDAQIELESTVENFELSFVDVHFSLYFHSHSLSVTHTLPPRCKCSCRVLISCMAEYGELILAENVSDIFQC